DHVFAPADASIIGMIAYEVRNSLTMWEPRIDVLDVVVSQDESRPTLLYIDVTYEVRDTNDPRNLVFPFYVIPAQESDATTGTEPRRPALPGPRRRRQAPGAAALPGVDGPQRLRPRGDPDRDVRLPRRPGPLPAQPRAGAQLRHVPRSDGRGAVPPW